MTTRPLDVCAEHLRLLGVDPLPCTIPSRPMDVDESLVQASSGLMAVHGGEHGVPRRIALDVVSIATGTLAAQGVLAAQFARMRGTDTSCVSTSPLQGALSYLYHHLAIATCGGSFPFKPLMDGAGPPFPTADGAWVELEALSGDAWVAFWKAVAVDERIASRAWLPFVYRHLAGRCVLPGELHTATRRETLDSLVRVASARGVALCRVRAHDEVTKCPTPWTFAYLNRSAPVSPSRTSTVDAPLAGVRVVEVTSRLQGPLAGQLLRALGAEVLKIEPRGGDFGRCSPPFAGSRGAAYLAYNHGKTVVELDYKQPADRARLFELVANGDVFLHNWPRNRAEHLGLDFLSLAKANPRIVYAHAAGWSKGMPEPAPIAGDQLVQAHSGCGDLLTFDGEPPAPSRLTFVDTMGGLLAVEGILAALCAREREPRAIGVDTSLFGGAMLLRESAVGRPARESLDCPLRTADGYLVARATCDAERETIKSLRLTTRSASEWIGPLAEAGIAAAVVHMDLACVPEQWKHTRVVEEVDDACWVPAAPWSFSALAASETTARADR